MEQKRPNSSEEIDLLYFFRPVSNAFRRLVDWLGDYIMLVAHNRFLFAAILLLGSIGGYCLRYVIAPSYKTHAIFISEMLPSRYCTSLLANLNELRRPANMPELAKTLGISQDAAWQIQGIIPDASPKDTFALEKRDSSMSLFRVTLVLHDMRYIGEIEKGLVNYLENNDYVRRRKEARINNLMEQKTALAEKLQSLDSLRRVVNSSVVPRSQGQGIILGEPINPVSIYQAEVAYLRERLLIEERLATIDHIEVLQPFLRLHEHNHPNYERMTDYAFIASFLFGLMVIPLIGRRPKKIINY
ncbi:MAG TPA: hypothetical protein VD993_08290 [Chitinophagaceae bacterium]|nr:hypothetical protein [Chitinophagaceae bacterium]